LTDYAELKKLRARMEVYAVLEKANGDFERRTNKGKRTAHDDRADDWKAAADAIAALEKQVADAREALEPFQNASALLDHTLSRDTRIFLGAPDGRYYVTGATAVWVRLGDFAVVGDVLSLPLQSGDIGDQEASGEKASPSPALKDATDE
jgi:hypothetical protein